MEKDSPKRPPELKSSIHIGCSGWRYWKWRDSYYAGVPQADWLEHYAKRFDTVEINASFYLGRPLPTFRPGGGSPAKGKLVYTVKVCELITHVKKFKGTKTLIQDFGMIADILGDRMGCFLFQLPPSYRFTRTRLNDIVSQLDPARRNVVEFRHASWWNEEVYNAFRKAGIIFCSTSGPGFPMSLFGRRTKYTSAFTVRGAGIGTIIRKRSCWSGRAGSMRVVRNGHGYTSTTITTPMPRRMPVQCGEY